MSYSSGFKHEQANRGPLSLLPLSHVYSQTVHVIESLYVMMEDATNAPGNNINYP